MTHDPVPIPDSLLAMFADEEVRRDAVSPVGGFQPAYIPITAILHRLNASCGLAWSFSIRQWQVAGAEIVVLGELTVFGVARQQFGHALMRMHDGQPACFGYDLKAAASDAIRKCASLFGVGAQVYARNESGFQGMGQVPPAAVVAQQAQAATLAGLDMAAPLFQIPLVQRVMVAAGYPENQWWFHLGLPSAQHMTGRLAASIISGQHPAVHGRVAAPVAMVGR